MRIICLFLLFVLSTSAHGEIYRWRDGYGVTHFASSMDDVPARYRSRVKAMKYGPESKGESAMPAAAQQGNTTLPTAVSAPLAPAGSGETEHGGNQSKRSKRGLKRSSAATAGEE